MNKKYLTNRQKIHFKIKKKIKGTADRPRAVVFRSLNNIYIQFVDDLNSKTIFSVASNEKDVASQIKEVKGKVGVSKIIGKIAAEKAKNANITNIVFDRNGYLYHGRVKAVADGLREGGLVF